MWLCFGSDYYILDLNLVQNEHVPKTCFSKVRVSVHFLKQHGFCIYPLSADEDGLHILNWKTKLDIFEEIQFKNKRTHRHLS